MSSLVFVISFIFLHAKRTAPANAEVCPFKRLAYTQPDYSHTVIRQVHHIPVSIEFIAVLALAFCFIHSLVGRIKQAVKISAIFRRKRYSDTAADVNFPAFSKFSYLPF